MASIRGKIQPIEPCQERVVVVADRPIKSTGPWDRWSQKKIDPRRKFSKLKKKKKKKTISEKN